MKTIRRKLGDKGEELAQEYLIKKGFQIVDRNFLCRFGELDIIAVKDKCLYFIEVKTRRTKSFGLAVEAVTPWKLNKMIRASYWYLAKNRQYSNLGRQMAIVSVDMTEACKIDFFICDYSSGDFL